MTFEELKICILDDLTILGLPTDFILELKEYHKTYEGWYNPNTKKVVVFTNDDYNKPLDYDTIIRVAIHEAIHHYQYVHDPSFKRYKGIMHNADFKRLEKLYNKKYDLMKEYVEEELYV